MRTEKLDLLLAGFTAFVVMAAVLGVWGLVRHRPMIEYRPESGGYLPYTGPAAAPPQATTIRRAPGPSPAVPAPHPASAATAPAVPSPADAGP